MSDVTNSADAVAAPAPRKRKMVLAPVGDGFDREEVVTSKQRPGLELTVKFRPPRAMEQIAYDSEIATLKGEAKAECMIAYFLRYLTAWDVELPDERGMASGRPAPRTRESFALIIEQDIIHALERIIGDSAWPAEVQLGN